MRQNDGVHSPYSDLDDTHGIAGEERIQSRSLDFEASLCAAEAEFAIRAFTEDVDV